MTFNEWFWETPNELGYTRSDYINEYCKNSTYYSEVVLLLQELYENGQETEE